MRSIDKIVYPNLTRRSDRRDHILNEFERNNFPLELVHRFEGHDGFDYPTTESICEAMIADGFGKAVSCRLESGLNEEYGGGDFAVLWTYLSIYHEFVDADPDSLMMFVVDDCVIHKDWISFQYTVSNLPEDFRLLQLCHWHPEQSDSSLELSPTFVSPVPYNSEIYYGLGGCGDFGLVMTPSGARQLLEWGETYRRDRASKGFHTDIMLWERSFDNPPGCYYTKDNYVQLQYDIDDDSDRTLWNKKFPSG